MRTLKFSLILLMSIFSAVSAAAQSNQALDPSERQAMSDTMQYALDNQGVNQPSEWVNPDTGRSGAVVPTRTFQNEQGQPCREFITTIIIGGREEQGYGTACRQPDGSWQIVRNSPAPSPPTPQTVFVPVPPQQYYSYPPEVYGGPRIYLSFSYIHRSGHQYYGFHYMDGPVFRHRYPVWTGRWDPPPSWRDGHYRRHFDDRGRHRGRR